MINKRGIELVWMTLIVFLFLIVSVVLYLVFTGQAGRTLTSAIDYIKGLFKFGG